MRARDFVREAKKHISPSGVETNMDPRDDDYDVNYGQEGGVAKFRKSQGLDVRTGSKKIKEQGVAEGDVIQGPWSGMNRPEPGERYAIVRTRPNGTRDFAAGHFDSWQKAKQELQKFLKHELHTELGHQFEIVKKKQGVAEATGNPGMPHDFTSVQPGAEVWYKGRFAGWTTGKVYDDPYGKSGKMVAFEPNPSEFPGDEGRVLSLPYDEVSLRKSTSIGKLKGPGQGVAEGILGDREYNRVMPVVKRIAGEVSDYDRDEFGEELWSLLDQKYGSKFAQSVLQDSLDFYWDEYAELTGQQGVSEGKKHISPSGVETTMDPEDDDYAINYGKNGGVAKFRKSQGLDVRTGSKKIKEQGVAETSDYFRRREREEAIISGQKPARKKAPAQTSDYARRREQEKKSGVAEVKDMSDMDIHRKNAEQFRKDLGLPDIDKPKNNKETDMDIHRKNVEQFRKWRDLDKKKGVSEGSNDSNDYYADYYTDLLSQTRNMSWTDRANTRDRVRRDLASGRIDLATLKTEIRRLDSEVKNKGVAEDQVTERSKDYSERGRAAYKDYNLSQQWMQSYEKIKQSDPEKADKIKKLVNQYKFTNHKLGGSRYLTKKEIERIINDFESQTNGQN